MSIKTHQTFVFFDVTESHPAHPYLAVVVLVFYYRYMCMCLSYCAVLGMDWSDSGRLAVPFLVFTWT